MTALYCEIDPFAAAWLRELIAQGHIAPGVVTETPLEDLHPHDVMQYDQVHLCAGIAVWSYALRRIGWPDDRRIWSSSFPCQPFSAAGKGLGFADERHLWPLGLHLIQQCRPERIVGEQVASKDGLAWLEVVFADLEASGYAVGAVDLCAAGVGAPHIRQRIWWVAIRLADAAGLGHDGRGSSEACGQPGSVERFDGLRSTSHMEHAPSDGRQQRRPEPSGRGAASRCGTSGLDHHHHSRLEGRRGGHQAKSGRVGEVRPVAEAGELGGVGNTCGQPGERDARAVPGAQASCGGSGRADGYDDHGYSDAGVSSGVADMQSGGWPGQPLRQSGGRPEAGVAGDHELGGVADNLGTERPNGQPGKRAGDDATGWNEGSTAPAGLRSDLRPGPTNGLWRDADWLFCRDGKWRPVIPSPLKMADGSAPDLVRVCNQRGGYFSPLEEKAPARVGRLRGYGNAIVAPLAEEFLRAALLDDPVNSAV